jgi:hypothetical protein
VPYYTALCMPSPALPSVLRVGLSSGDAKERVASCSRAPGALPAVHSHGLADPAPHAALGGAGRVVAVIKHLVISEATCCMITQAHNISRRSMCNAEVG